MRPYKRSFKNFFIDKNFQTKYLLITIVLLLTYTFIFTIILFLPSMLTLYFDASLTEKTNAARNFLVLHNTVWPTTGTVILIFGIFSIFLTHKISGPVYRLKCALTELVNGNLNSKIYLRKWDDLQELATQVNLLSDELRSYVNTLKKDHEQFSNSIDQLEKEVNTETGIAIIGQLQEQKKAMGLILERFTSKT